MRKMGIASGTARGVAADTRRANVTAMLMIVIRMAVQATVLFSIGRVLGAAGYGAFAAVVSLAALFAPLSGMGADVVALRTVAQHPEMSRRLFYRGMWALTVTGLPLVLIAGAASWWWFGEHVSFALVCSVLFADILMLRIPEFVAKIYQGRQLITAMGTMRLLPSLFRLLALGLLWLLPLQVTPAVWASFYVAGSMAAALGASWWLLRESEDNQSAADPPALLSLDGLHFAGGILSARLHSEGDKALVLGLSGPADAGIYSAASRVVEFSLIPVYAAQSVIYGRLFADAQRGGKSVAARTGLFATGYCATVGLLAAAALWVALVPAMTWALGDSYRAVEAGLLPISLLPAAMSLRLSGEQTVAAIGALRGRSVVQWSLAGVALAANLWLIPTHGWIAAAWVCVGVEALLGSAYLVICARAMSCKQ